MMNVSVCNAKVKKNKSRNPVVRLISRQHYSFETAADILQGIISIMPSSIVDRDLYKYIARSYHDGLQGDWNRVGDDMWLSISKYAANNSK